MFKFIRSISNGLKRLNINIGTDTGDEDYLR